MIQQAHSAFLNPGDGFWSTSYPQALGWEGNAFLLHLWGQSLFSASCLHLKMNSSPGISPKGFTIPWSSFSSQLYPDLSANQTNWSCINPVTYLFSIRLVVGSLWQMKGNLRLLPFKLQKFGNLPYTLKWHEQDALRGRNTGRRRNKLPPPCC